MKSTLRFFVISCAMLSGLASAAEVTLETDQQKLSYVLGFQLGKQFQQQGFDVDVTTLGLAIQEAMNDAEPRLNGEQARAVMEKQQKKQMEAQAQAGSKNAEAGEKFLADNKGKPGVVTLENGLQYKVVKAGSGKKPKETDSVTVHYRGALIDGTEFDSSYSRGEPTSFPVNRVISGWTQVLHGRY